MYEHDIALAVQDPKFLARFWSKIEKSDACWAWSGAISDGYGEIAVPCRRVKHGSVTIRAHRIAWTIAHGEIPAEAWTLHRCDVRACTNPEHLFLGDNAENMRDASRKGRLPLGAANHQARLTAELVRAIRADPLSEIRAASKYGVSSTTIGDVRRRLNWKHVD
jgi:hypothetical protein